MNKINLTCLLLCSLIISGCSGMLTDLFVGIKASDEESWHKKGMTIDSQREDFTVCSEEADKLYPLNGNYEVWEKNYFHFQTCLLAKGYKFYPRGLDGKRATRCHYDDGPACKSRRFF